MKTNFVKQILSVAAFGVAIAGAFTSNAMTQRAGSVALKPGHERIGSSVICSVEKRQCSDINNNQPCTFQAKTMWGKDPVTNECTVPLYLPTQP